MKSLSIGLTLALILVGCSGEATLKLVNNTSRYVSGAIDGESFGLPASGETTRTVEVGGFFSSSSKVKVEADVHATYEMTSREVYHLERTMTLEKDQTYSWEVYYPSSYSAPALRLTGMESEAPLLAP